LSSYFIDKFEVSNEEYTKFILATDHPAPAYWDHHKLNGSRQPVTGVNWFDANTYCLWANKRLPTEAEWEKAARGPAGFIYPWGNKLDSSKANFAKGKSGEKHITDGIDSYPEGKSYYGAYNMAGNVFEWVHDWYDPNYYKSSTDIRNPQGPSLGVISTKKILNKYQKLDDKKRVIRGGSWFAPAASITTTHRFWNNPMNNSYGVGLGFRCARDKEPESSLEARSYYMDALVQIGENKFQSAKESIENAINISPNNEEYISMKKLIENSLN
jgi:gamma-glutamyl hercynylcysteine S-oxide synthase